MTETGVRPREATTRRAFGAQIGQFLGLRIRFRSKNRDLSSASEIPVLLATVFLIGVQAHVVTDAENLQIPYQIRRTVMAEHLGAA